MYRGQSWPDCGCHQRYSRSLVPSSRPLQTSAQPWPRGRSVSLGTTSYKNLWPFEFTNRTRSARGGQKGVCAKNMWRNGDLAWCQCLGTHSRKSCHGESNLHVDQTRGGIAAADSGRYETCRSIWNFTIAQSEVQIANRMHVKDNISPDAINNSLAGERMEDVIGVLTR